MIQLNQLDTAEYLFGIGLTDNQILSVWFHRTIPILLECSFCVGIIHPDGLWNIVQIVLSDEHVLHNIFCLTSHNYMYRQSMTVDQYYKYLSCVKPFDSDPSDSDYKFTMRIVFSSMY